MENNRFRFCPDCGSKNIETLNGGRKWVCPDCGFKLYNNTASAVAVIITNKNGEVLFEKRAKEPRKGFLALPGGFTEAEESGENAAIRECREETGIEAEGVKYIASFPNTYIYSDIIYKTCDLFFTARLPYSYELKAQKGEVQEFVWLKIENEEDVENANIAFPSTKKALLAWVSKK